MRTMSKVRHTTVSPELRAYAEDKIGNRVLHYLPDADDAVLCEIEFDDQLGPKAGLDKRVDVTITLPHQHLPLHIEETDLTFEEAINKVVDRLDQPLEKYKETH